MQGNDYGGLLPRWKVELIGRRARRLGFSAHEIPDLEQAIVMELLAVAYDPQGTASERTFVTAVIDRQLKEILRSRSRHRRRVSRDAVSLHAHPAAEEAAEARPDAVELRLDLEQALMGLTPTERAICAALIGGGNQADIARERGCSRAAVGKHVARVAEKFRRWGLEAYLPGRKKGGKPRLTTRRKRQATR